MSDARLIAITSSDVSSLELKFCLDNGETVSYPCSVDELHDAEYGTVWLVHGSEAFYAVCRPWVAEQSYALRAAAAYAAMFGGPWVPTELRAVGDPSPPDGATRRRDGCRGGGRRGLVRAQAGARR